MSFVWFCNFRVISVCFLWGKSVLAASLSKSCLETKNKKKQNLWFSGLFSWICFGSVKTVHSRNFQTRMKSIASQNLKTPRGIRLDFHASSVFPHVPTAIWSISVDLMCCYIRRKPPHSKTHQKKISWVCSLCLFVFLPSQHAKTCKCDGTKIESFLQSQNLVETKSCTCNLFSTRPSATVRQHQSSGEWRGRLPRQTGMLKIHLDSSRNLARCVRLYP